MQLNRFYTEDFYENQQETSRKSAKEVVPFVLDLIQPKHVIDVGCGVGAWLSVFKDLGVEGICGVDGEWVDEKMLNIPKECFQVHDLKKPLHMHQQFDLVVSLEVAEHLPGECAETFIESLTNLGPVVLFSAAIPLQGGTNHINEQWPDYWVKLFEKKGFAVIDYIRKKVWNNENVDSVHAQNTLLFARHDYLENHPVLRKERDNTVMSQLSIVHPRRYLLLLDPNNLSLSDVLPALPIVTKNAIMSRIKRLFPSR